AGGGVFLGAHSGLLSLLGDVVTFLADRSFEPADSFDGYPGDLGDVLRGLARPDTGLDFLGAQRILHFDLVLAEAGELAAYSGAEAVVDGQHETSVMAGTCEHQIGAGLAHGHEAELVDGASLRGPWRGGLRSGPPGSPRAGGVHRL